ncbi:urease accessory protein UreE [Neisseria sp. S1]|uniref:urease accessory protein UreE n=1 Tax=Neisseria sp. S1 TaxID=3318354 RepID=UPI003A88DDD0
MNLIIQEILPKDKALSPIARHDYVVLEWYEADRRILRKTTISGRDISFRLLQEGQRLQHGDIVFADEHLVISIEIKLCDAIVMAPKTLTDMARTCYEIGNKHSPLFLDGDELVMPYDKPMFLWLQAAGFAPKQEKRRLNQVLRANSAPGIGGGHIHKHEYRQYHNHSHSEIDRYEH